MLDRECSHVGIGNQICVQTRQGEKLVQDVSMAFRWLRDPHELASQPLAHLAPCISYRLRPLEYPGIGHQTQEGQ